MRAWWRWAGMGLVCLTQAATSPSVAGEQYWSGFYAGANLGLHDVITSGIFDASELGNPAPNLKAIGDTGVNLGIHGGYGYQLDRIFLGIEGDVSLGGFNESLNTIQDGSASEAGLLQYPIEGNLRYLATLRGRLGVEVESMFPRPVLVFVTGGLAHTEFQMDIANGRGEVGFSDFGPVWGGGVEIALSPQAMLRTEYLHAEFNKRLSMTDEVTSGIFDANDGNFVQLRDVDIVRVGITFRLGK
jgi:outer membrane immunogenic protein